MTISHIRYGKNSYSRLDKSMHLTHKGLVPLQDNGQKWGVELNLTEIGKTEVQLSCGAQKKETTRTGKIVVQVHSVVAKKG